MCKKCWVIVSLLICVIAGMTYKFMFQGSVVQSTDGRMSIQLESAERDLVLAEMRMFLEAVQAITAAVTKDDMGTVVASAKKVGGAAQQAVPGSLMGKLPMAFKQLGFDTHQKFDQLALDAEQMGDAQTTLEQLGTLMQNCVGCHASYRLESVTQM